MPSPTWSAVSEFLLGSTAVIPAEILRPIDLGTAAAAVEALALVEAFICFLDDEVVSSVSMDISAFLLLVALGVSIGAVGAFKTDEACTAVVFGFEG